MRRRERRQPPRRLGGRSRPRGRRDARGVSAGPASGRDGDRALLRARIHGCGADRDGAGGHRHDREDVVRRSRSRWSRSRLWAAAFSRRSPRAHLRALVADARCSRWILVPGLAGLTAFAIEKLRRAAAHVLSSSEAAWRYWADGLEILRAGGVPATTLQWGIHIPTTVSKVVLNSFEAGVVSVAPNGALLTMAALVWLGERRPLRGPARARPRARPARPLRRRAGAPPRGARSAPINAEFTQDADIYRVETLGRMVAVCAAVVAIARGARARRPAGGRGGRDPVRRGRRHRT